MATSLKYTPVDDISRIHDELEAAFKTGKTKPIAYRKQQLLAFMYMLKDNAEQIADAITADLGRNKQETTMIDLSGPVQEALVMYNNIEKWAADEKTPFSLNFFAMGPKIRKEPKGVILIIGPFNFPLWCMLGPCAAAIATGNTVCLKPSEQIVATSKLIAKLVPKYMDNDTIRVVNGAIPETTKLLELRWDHIMYTGSGRVAKIVSAAAAKHLTPVSLELGGQNPVIIDPSCDVALAARRILWGRNVNGGQICLAPEYVLVPRHFQDTFVNALKAEYQKFYPEADCRTSPSCARMVSLLHFTRIKKMLDRTKGTIVLGGQTDEKQLFIAPTVVRDCTKDDSLMEEEIFGPILPIVPVKDLDEAIQFVNDRDHALALYVFSKDATVKKTVMDRTQSGSVLVNEVVLQSAADGLPFGGIGPSGTGSLRGKYAFDMFTHKRATLDSPGFIDLALGARYPPYTDKKNKALWDICIPKLPPRDGSSGAGLTTYALIALALAGGAGWWNGNLGKVIAGLTH